VSLAEEPVHNAYGPRFWATYVSNIALMVAVSLLFRYADFVSSLGGSEDQLGFITGLGMIGGIAARCFLGVAIDSYGAGRVWVLSLLLLVCCLLGHLAIHSLQPPFIHLLRILYTIALAGNFGASITFVTLRAPASRMGEMIGMLGSSGFIGMGIGPSIGDWLLAEVTPETLATKLFYWSAGAAALSLLFAFFATFGLPRPNRDATDHREEKFSWAQLARRYHPGWTLLVGFAMGLGIGMPGTFVSAFADVKGIAELGWYWTPYTVTAFLVRMATRKLSDQWGTRPTTLLGLSCLGISQFAYLLVSTPTTLIIPAVLGGFGHALLFPAAMSEGNQSFPPKYRGIATTLMLMMFDIGMLVGQPVFGWTIEFARAAGLNEYSVAFSLLGVTLLLIAVLYGCFKKNERVEDQHLATLSREKVASVH